MIMFDLDEFYLVKFGTNAVPFPNKESLGKYLDDFSNAFDIVISDAKVFHCKKIEL